MSLLSQIGIMAKIRIDNKRAKTPPPPTYWGSVEELRRKIKNITQVEYAQG